MGIVYIVADKLDTPDSKPVSSVESASRATTFINDKPSINASKCDLCGECVDACVAGAREIIGRKISVGEVMTEIEKEIVFYEQSKGGVTFSGGEPLMQPVFLLTVLKRWQL